jgi:hypothetical protein
MKTSTTCSSLAALALLLANGCISGAPDAEPAPDEAVGVNRAALTGDPCRTAAECNDANPCTVDRCTRGRCEYANKADGVTCSDNNACTKSDVCQAGVCLGGPMVPCAPPNQCQTANGCNPSTGKCVYFAKRGAACDDGNPCTQGDQCTGAAAGVCKGVRRPKGSACDDGNSCTRGDQCTSAGACAGAAQPDGTTCDDGNPDTVGDVCALDVCGGVDHCLGVTCASADQCHGAGACDHATGACSSPNAPDGTPCDDGAASTIDDVCTAGLCAGTIVPTSFDVACDTTVGSATPVPGLSILSGQRTGLIVAEDAGVVARPFQDPTGAVHIPIGYGGPLTLRFHARYTNDTASSLDLVNVRPFGFSHMMGGAQLQYPSSENRDQGTFVTHWTITGIDTIHLAPGDFAERSFFDSELISTFGPVLAAMTTPYGWTSPAYTLVVGDLSRFFCQVKVDEVRYDDCLTKNGGCSADATCTATDGARTCACNAGFTGDGITCAPTGDGGVTPPPP